MASIPPRSKKLVADLLGAVKQLSSAELSQFEQEIAAWRNENNGSAYETALRTCIRHNSTLPVRDQRRFDRLRHKRQAERLNPSEAEQLQALWQRVEQMNVTRVAALAELARLHGTDVKTIMGELGLGEQVHVF
jgi:hypothetical protein